MWYQFTITTVHKLMHMYMYLHVHVITCTNMYINVPILAFTALIQIITNFSGQWNLNLEN